MYICIYVSDAKSPGFTGSLPVWNLTSRSPGERTKSHGIHVGPIVLSVINSENPKKCKRYKQLVLKSSQCINCTEVKRHSPNHVVLTLTPEVNIVGINYLIKFVQFCCEISIGFAVPHSTVLSVVLQSHFTVPALIPGGLFLWTLIPRDIYPRANPGDFSLGTYPRGTTSGNLPVSGLSNLASLICIYVYMYM